MNHLAAIIAVTLSKPFLRAEQLILRIRNLALYFARRQELFIDIQLLDDFLERAHLVIIIVNRKRARVTQLFNIPAKNLCTAGMECGYPYVRSRFTGQLFNSLAHFRSSLVGKRNGHNGPRRHTMRKEVCYAIRKCSRFSRACARKYQQRPLKRFRREPLFFVEIVEIHLYPS